MSACTNHLSHHHHHHHSVTLDELLKYALLPEQLNRQFVIITPNNLNNVKTSANVKIQRMQKVQSSLSHPLLHALPIVLTFICSIASFRSLTVALSNKLDHPISVGDWLAADVCVGGVGGGD